MSILPEAVAFYCAIWHNKREKGEIGLEKTYDAAQVDRWLRRSEVGGWFDIPELTFALARFARGEYLTAPGRPLPDLLFVVQGTVQIYGVRLDGRLVPVNLAQSPTLLGDMEFATRGPAPFFAQARTEVLCLCLPLEPCRDRLARDVKFLHRVLQSFAEKLLFFSAVDLPAATTEERVLFYLQHSAPDHTLQGVEAATLLLRCSRRQLQRALKKLCEAGRVEKTGKGRYRLCP